MLILFVKRNFLPYITKRWWYCECKVYITRLQVYLVTTCYTLLHQVTRPEGKNSSRERRDILVLIVILKDFSLLYYLNFNL